MKRPVQIIVWILVIGAIAVWFFHTKNDVSERLPAEQAREDATRKAIDATRKAIVELADKHNAVRNWRKRFVDKLGPFRPGYTIDLEDALIGANGNPVLFFGGVIDVVRKDEKYFVYFSKWPHSSTYGDFLFILECTPEQVKTIRSRPSNELGNYAVISQIIEVRKVRFELKETDSTPYFDPSNVFIANGRCIDLVFAGNSGSYPEDEISDEQ